MARIAKKALERAAAGAAAAIEEATGIPLDAGDVALVARGAAAFSIRVFGAEVARLRPEPGTIDPRDPAPGVAEALRDEIDRAGADHVRDGVVRARIALLERALAPALREAKRRLRDEAGLDDLDFAVRDLGYDYRHYTMPEEVERGYPAIALVVSTPDERERVFDIDPLAHEAALDVEDVVRGARELLLAGGGGCGGGRRR